MDITAQVHRYLTTARTSHFLDQSVTVLDHWVGRDNLLWRIESRGQEAVLKLFLDAGQARGRRQYDGQERLAPLGIAPRPLWFDRYPEGLSRQVLVYAWQPGQPIDLADAGQRAALAASIAQVHNGDVTAVRRFCPNPVNLDYWWRVVRGSIAPILTWLNSQNADPLSGLFTELTKRAATLVEAALPLWANTPPTPVHGDLRHENVLHQFGAAVLLDWEFFGLGDPALDVAAFLHRSQANFIGEAQEEWLARYLASFDQPGLAGRIGVYGRLLPLQSLCFLLDGLRNAPRNDADLASAAPFLAVTLSATWQQSAQALEMDGIDFAQAIQPLFRI